MMKEKIIKSIEKIGETTNKLLQDKNEITNEKLEEYFMRFEKERMDMYDYVIQNNTWLEFEECKRIETITDEYEVTLKNDILKIYIPEKLPSIKKGLNYIQKQIIYNISKAVKPYKDLFYDRFTMTIIKIYDDCKIWDADNRNVKPIQDGLVNGKVIQDDNIYSSCYMVQGYYSDKPHIEVYVVPANEITTIINQKLR